jgi:putative DNA primase/helicase
VTPPPGWCWCPDTGKEESAAEIAQAVGAAVAYMPQGEAQNFDANDLAQRDGFDVLAGLLEAANRAPEAIEA